MITNRKFYRTILQVEILSEEPYEWDDLKGVAYSITDGECVGEVTEKSRKTLNGKQTARKLVKLGSAPDFFRLTPSGEDSE